jgi:hypothetical protein
MTAEELTAHVTGTATWNYRESPLDDTVVSRVLREIYREQPPTY